MVLLRISFAWCLALIIGSCLSFQLAWQGPITITTTKGTIRLPQVVEKANATFYTLCRNDDIYDLLETISNYNARFNGRFNYDWVFLNDKPFSDEFKRMVNVSVAGNAYFGQIPAEHWSLPDSVNKTLLSENMQMLLDDPDGPPPYADSLSYRHMCRFESGFFYKHELLEKYDYFWRVEPGVKLHCNINYDIFKYMADNDIDYGFTMSLVEYIKTIPSLFPTFKDSLKKMGASKLLSDPNNYSEFIVDPSTGDYNFCHFWTNFEIGNLNVFRSRVYNDLFDRLDRSNGFYYERWGDAPVRTLILSTILTKGKIKRFQDIGYTHSPYTQCPKDEVTRMTNRCSCDPDTDFTDKWYSCSWYFDQFEAQN